MDQLLGLAGSALDLLLVVVGFGSSSSSMTRALPGRQVGRDPRPGVRDRVWSGGGVVSKGMGWRRGSSEKDYTERMNAQAAV